MCLKNNNDTNLGNQRASYKNIGSPNSYPTGSRPEHAKEEL